MEEDRLGQRPWKKWGPYLSERQWGTVREDYSAGGDAWNYFPHDHARSRAYRWGGPIWFPVNYLIIESLQKFHHYYGDDFKVECPTGSGRLLTIGQVAEELSRRLTRIFLRDESGRRPVVAYHDKLHGDPHFRDHVLFHEYFCGDTGRSVGASHQTGWTGLVAKLLQPRRTEPRELCGAKQAEEDELPAGSQLAAPGISGS